MRGTKASVNHLAVKGRGGANTCAEVGNSDANKSGLTGTPVGDLLPALHGQVGACRARDPSLPNRCLVPSKQPKNDQLTATARSQIGAKPPSF
ncbi:hypothetical protein J6590_042121 [Homalodisca vitripennis]|nr:hypothetical protein J6590_038719 [Homalodisca vitripennis]KAG8336600.1 hypothetical protein J6590_042121 [Homalodisca vitripennis]